MTREEALTIIKNTKVEYDKPQRFVRGLNILAKYDNDIDPSFEHDQCWASDFDSTIEKMTREDVEALAQCGWFESEESWSHF